MADELAGTRQAAAEHRQTAVLRRAEADAAATADPARAEKLQAAATAAEALADDLDSRVGLLEETDRAYNWWLMEGAVTQLEGERADHALALLHADRPPEPDVTAEAWIAAQDARTRAEEEAHRPVTEDDIDTDRPHDADQFDTTHQNADAATPMISQRDDDRAADERARDDEAPVLETDVADLREVAAAEPARRNPTHQARIAPLQEAIDANADARRTIAEIRARTDYAVGLTTEEDRDADLPVDDPFVNHADRYADDDDSGEWYIDDSADGD